MAIITNEKLQADMKEVLELTRQPENKDLRIYVSSLILMNEFFMKKEVKQAKSIEGNPFMLSSGAWIEQSQHLPENSYIALKGHEVVAQGSILKDEDYANYKKNK